MNTEEFISIMKDLIRCYEQSKNGSVTQREILMWRERFLNSLPLDEDIHKSEYVRNVFLQTPGFEILRNDPLAYIKNISENLCKDNK